MNSDDPYKSQPLVARSELRKPARELSKLETYGIGCVATVLAILVACGTCTGLLEFWDYRRMSFAPVILLVLASPVVAWLVGIGAYALIEFLVLRWYNRPSSDEEPD